MAFARLRVRVLPMTRLEIQAGICGFTTRVEAESIEGYNACFRLDSQCPNWKKVNEIMGGKELDLMKELFKDRETGELNSSFINLSLKTIPHVSCPVISGVLKALEVAAGLALAKDASITFKE